MTTVVVLAPVEEPLGGGQEGYQLQQVARQVAG